MFGVIKVWVWDFDEDGDMDVFVSVFYGDYLKFEYISLLYLEN